MPHEAVRGYNDLRMTPKPPFTDVETAIDEIRSGRMIIVVDDEDRENEGDFICAAEKVTPELLRKRTQAVQDQFRADAQLAFYGGNFTGLPFEEQQSILFTARELIEQGLIGSVRISTRPDYVTQEIVQFLKAMKVATVELGAESMIDVVLAASQRGHTAADTANAVNILRANGIETVVHLMAGLPGDTRAGFIDTVRQVVLLNPDMVRIHPTVVFEGTGLAELYGSGQYHPLGLHEEVHLLGRHELRGENEVALVLAVLIVRDDDELAGTQVVEHLLDGRKWH